MITLLPGIKHGESITWYSVYTPFGSVEEVETGERTASTLPVDDDGLLFIDRAFWKTVFTYAGQLSTDGTRLPGIPFEDAHIDDSMVSYLGMSKKGKEENNKAYSREPGFIIDMRYTTLFNRLCWIHRNETGNSNLYYHGVDVWGTNNYRGPINKYQHAESAVDEDPNTVWTFIKRVDLGVDRNGNPIADGRPPINYNPPLKPTNNLWQAPLFDIGECKFRYVRIQAYKYDVSNSNKVCISDFRLYYQTNQ
jgi:hypothetical protein